MVVTPQSNTAKTPSEPLFDPMQLPNLESLRKTSELAIDDLELIHHFSTVTYRTLIDSEADARVWSYDAVRLGLKHEFLLRGILAVAALHLADLMPDESAAYELKATTHQNLALVAAQEELAHPSVYNCHALFLFSCLVIFLTFVGSRHPQDNDGLPKHMLDWFYVLRGCNSVMQMYWTHLENSSCYAILKEVKKGENHSAHTAEDSHRIIDLLSLTKDIEDQEDRRAYSLAVHELLKTYTQCWFQRQNGRPWIIPAFVWPNVLPERYLQMLGDQKPQALVILAHFAILIHWSDEDWFFRGWARDLLQKIRATVDEEWHEHLRWPEEVTARPPDPIPGSICSTMQ
ncbi:MAG: hypothetical protein Q9227_008028 [Pyrenula ochraceoflavens]